MTKRERHDRMKRRKAWVGYMLNGAFKNMFCREGGNCKN